LASRRVRAFVRPVLWRVAGAFPAALVAGSMTHGCGVDRQAFTAGDGGSVEASSQDASDDGVPLADGSACRPGDVQTYVPGRYHPATAAWQGACEGTQVQGFYDACLGPQASTDACRAFSRADAGNAPCASCILTQEPAAAYGPLVAHGTLITENVGGCIELTDPSGLPCAKEQQALLGCQLAACEANCPVHDATTRAAYDACASTASMAGCQAYAVRASCTQEGGASSVCVGQTFQAFYFAVVPRFCGSPPLLDAAPPHEAGASDATAIDAPAGDGPVTDGASGDAAAADGPPADAGGDSRGDAAPSD
jgi:hypothetical protein